MRGFARALDFGVSLVHDIRKFPWGQNVLRLYDPDGHVVEIGESMEFVVRRMLREGLTPEQAAQQTGFPIEYTRHCAL